MSLSDGDGKLISGEYTDGVPTLSIEKNGWNTSHVSVMCLHISVLSETNRTFTSIDNMYIKSKIGPRFVFYVVF